MGEPHVRQHLLQFTLIGSHTPYAERGGARRLKKPILFSDFEMPLPSEKNVCNEWGIIQSYDYTEFL